MSQLLVAQRALTVPGWAKDALWRRAQAIPSLDLRFADSKSLVDATTGAQLVTFTRASSGTFVGSDGLIRTAVTNLLLRSEEFDNASWALAGSATVTANTWVAPNGTTSGDTITNGTQTDSIGQDLSVAASTAYTFSFYLNKSATTALFLRIRFAKAAGASGNVWLNVSNMSLADYSNGATNGIVSQITADVYRVSVVMTFAAGDAGTRRITIGASTTSNSGTSDSGKTFAIWGAQLEQSSTVGEYIPTTSTINSAPRFDHNPTTGESLGLLVEEARTNLLLRSEEFDNASWSKANSTVTANAVTAPDNLSTADKIVVNNGASGFDAVLQGVTITANAVTTLSGFFKAAEYTAVRIQNSQGGNGYIAAYNLSTGALISQGAIGTGTIVGHGIQVFPGGWYRIWVSGTITSGATNAAWRIQISDTSGTAVTGDGTSGIYAWGAQLEAGAFPTSYIPTTTATVTRSADVASDTTRGGNIRSLFAQFRSPASGTRPVVSLDDNTANERIEILTSGTDPKLLVTDGGSAVADLNAGAVSANTTARIAARFNTDDYAISINGGTSQLDAAGTLPTATRVRIGSNQAGGYLNGTIARITGWESALPNLPTVTQ